MGFAFLISVLFIMAFLIINGQLKTTRSLANTMWGKEHPAFSAEFIFAMVLSLYVIIRLVLAYFLKGYPTDMSCWFAWGARLAENGPVGFYAEDYFCDYPPGYLYILGLLSRFANTFGIQDKGMELVFKLPPILCDAILAGLIFKTAKKNFSDHAALLTAVIFMLCPVFALNSAAWGQIESVLILFIFLSLLALYEKKYYKAVICFILAVLIKPQGLLITPIVGIALLVDLIKTKNFKHILLAAFSGIVVFFALTMPFSPAWEEYTGFAAFLHAFNPIWIIQKYLSTLGSYEYFTVNAFNFYGLIHLNWGSLNEIGNRTVWDILNYATIGISVAGALVIYFKVKNRGSKLFLSAYFLLAFLFTFGLKMHERYVLLAIAMLLFEYLFSRNKKILYLFAGYSSVCFLNLFYILRLVLTTKAAPTYGYTGFISLLEVILFACSVYVIIKDYLLESKEVFAEPEITITSRLENIQRFSPFMNVLKGETPGGEIPPKNEKMLRLDYLILAGMMVVYGVLSFTNLGNTYSPQTYYQPEQKNEVVTITLDELYTIDRITYFCGIGDVTNKVGMQMDYSEDGLNWFALPSSCKVESVFKWGVETFNPVDAQYIRCRPASTDYRLFEIGIWDTSGTPVGILDVAGNGNANYTAIADEQQYLQYDSSIMNGTYFDEIYHARTAYEHLHMMPYYETTHPPLGKLMMSVGVALFGMTPFGWRFTGTLFGLLMLPIFYYFLKKFFGRTRYAVMGTLLFGFDFMHYSLTRIATIDSYPVFFILAMFCFMYQFGKHAIQYAKEGTAALRNKQHIKKLFGLLALSGFSMGLGCASKWTAIYASVGLAVAFLLIMIQVYRTLGKKHKNAYMPFLLKIGAWCVLFFIVVPGSIYLLSYLPISMVKGYGNVFQAMWKNQEYMLNYHSQLKGTHPYMSNWYTWPFVYKPMWAYSGSAASATDSTYSSISFFPNPLMAWTGIAAFVYTILAGIKKKDLNVLFLMVALMAQYLPWILVSRYSLMYHFFATTPFLVICIIYTIADLEKRFKRFGYTSVAFVTVCMLLFILFFPVLSGIPTTPHYLESMLEWFDPWVFQNII